MNTIKLRGPNGCDEANLGGRMFHPHDDGYFHIDADLDVEPLLRVGGFYRADVSPAPPVTEKQPTTLDDVMALARTLPHGDLRSQLLGAIATVAKSAPRSTTRLIAPKGCDGFSHAGERFDVDERGFVNAPNEAVDSLCRVGGYAVATNEPPPSPLAEPASTDSDVAPPAVEIANAPPVAPMLPRLTMKVLADLPKARRATPLPFG
jgi:hypothetical protein